MQQVPKIFYRLCLYELSGVDFKKMNYNISALSSHKTTTQKYSYEVKVLLWSWVSIISKLKCDTSDFRRM